MMYQYVYKLRPPGPGCQPRQGLMNTVAFDDKKEYRGVYCWGYAEYNKPLDNPNNWDMKAIN